MSKTLRIDLVAPPFAGHLFPMLDLASWLSRQFNTFDSTINFQFRLLSTESSRDWASRYDLDFAELLLGCDQQVRSIANYPAQVGSNPRHLLRQFLINLSLMKQMQSELRTLWSSRSQRPDLVLADFTVPVAGITATQTDIPWWTAIASPCAMEIPGSVPSYLGGWLPRQGLLYRVRDAAGRRLVRGFKASVGYLFQRKLRELGIDSIYRADGLESIYSSQCVLAYGLRDFEFVKQWPDHVHFIGPCTMPPPNDRSVVPVSKNRIGVLVSLGTHLSWAKDSALAVITEVAKRMPEFEFHFSLGDIANESIQRPLENLIVMSSIPYDDRLRLYKVAIVHGGAGLVYACTQSGLPMLVWPHDFDQFDHAARIKLHGLGIWGKPKVEQTIEAIRTLTTNSQYTENLRRFQDSIQQIDRRAIFEQLFGTLAPLR